MRDKKNIIWLIFPIIYLFWLFFRPGHIEHWEGTNFFQYGSLYWSNFAIKPGGWSDYIEHFLLQLYRWVWLGALIQTLLLLGVFICTRGIIKKLGFEKNTLIISTLPIILIFLLQNDIQIVEGQIIELSIFFLLIWGYLQIKNSLIRNSIATLASPIIFVMLGGVGTIAIYLALSTYVIWRDKDRSRFGFIAAWVVLIALQPLIWPQYIYITSIEGVYSASIHDYLIVSIYSYTSLLIVIAWVNRERYTEKDLVIVELISISIMLCGAIYFSANSTLEHFFRLDQAAIDGEWDEVLDLAENIKELSREEVYLINLALASKGDLGDNLFKHNPKFGTAGLYLPRSLDYTTSVIGGEFYFRCEIPNEAIHWTFQGSIASAQGMDFRALKRLIELNILKNDTLIADKYLTILENSTCYGSWCAERRAELANPKTEHILPSNRDNFFVGTRPFISEMARVSDAGRGDRLVLDYMLCYLLLDKDLKKFYYLMNILYPSDGKPIPKAYQEAILMDINSNKRILKRNYTIDPEISRQFVEYNTMNPKSMKNREQAIKLMAPFKSTLWYYLNFTTPPKVDPRGQIHTQIN